MTFQSFSEVAALDLPAQRRLLQGGKPEEQVWAGWAMGLELGERAKAETE